MRTDVLKRRDLRDARYWFEEACRESRAHLEHARCCLLVFGDQGPQVSAVVRDHFPHANKVVLRELAHRVTVASDRAWRAKPRGVHASTMRALASAVAARDGSGFCGPQP